MLKLKDNVDFNELEKYGFRLITYINQNVYKKSVTKGTEIQNYIVGEDRIIHFNNMSMINSLDNTLYDLIINDMVEATNGNN